MRMRMPVLMEIARRVPVASANLETPAMEPYIPQMMTAKMKNLVSVPVTFIIILMHFTAARPSWNVQAKRVTFPEDRFYSDLQHWADIKLFLLEAPIV
jgi:hypothetical protein